MRSSRKAFFLALSLGCAAAAGAACGSGSGSGPGAATSPLPVGSGTLATRACPPGNYLTYVDFGEPFFTDWCTGCHSSGTDNRHGAPAAANFDTLDQIRQWAPQIYSYSADTNSIMPPIGALTTSYRFDLGSWLACGAP